MTNLGYLTYHLGGDVVEVGDTNLSSIIEDLRLHNLDQLLDTINAIDVGVHESTNGQTNQSKISRGLTYGRPMPTALTPRASSLMASVP